MRQPASTRNIYVSYHTYVYVHIYIDMCIYILITCGMAKGGGAEQLRQPASTREPSAHSSRYDPAGQSVAVHAEQLEPFAKKA